jgi:O-6-methylguanine DNA methyltransferase
MQCKSVLTRADAFRTGELAGHEHDAVGDHLETCRSCRDSVADIDTFASAVRALRTSPSKSCSTDVCAAVTDSWDTITSGDLRIHVVFGASGVKRIDLSGLDDDAFRDDYRRRYARDIRREAVPSKIRRAIEAALAGKSADLPPVDLSTLGEFQRKVLETIQRIPRGEVRTYEWVARTAGRPAAVRAVGNTMAGNPLPLLLPCHRVVPTSGGLGEYVYGPAMKRRLLEIENVPVEELDRLAKSKVRYIGSRTTRIFCMPTCHDAQRICEENRVPFRDASEAAAAGFRPCKRCTPVAA